MILVQWMPRFPCNSLEINRVGPKFNVEWSSGMRFCSPQESNLSQGMANDFGAHVMQTNLLPEFLGVNDDNENAMQG